MSRKRSGGPWRPSWRHGAVALTMSAWLLPLSAPAAGAELKTAEADSLVWYIEQLEADLELCRVDAAAAADSLGVDLRLMATRLEWAQEERARWYHDPRLWFLVGAASATLAVGLSLRIAF